MTTILVCKCGDCKGMGLFAIMGLYRGFGSEIQKRGTFGY